LILRVAGIPQRADKAASARYRALEKLQEAAEEEAESLKVDLAAAAKVQKDRNRLQSEIQECHAATEEMAAEAESLRKSVADKNRTIHELRGVQQEARDLQEETLHLKSEVQRLTKSSMDKVRLQQDLAEALSKVEELGGDAIKHAKLASERTKLLDQMDRLQEECETLKLEAHSLRKAATDRDKALGQVEQHVSRIQELEDESRRTAKQLLDKERAVADGKSAAAQLAEAQQQISLLEVRNDALERDVARLSKSVAETNMRADDFKDKLETEQQRIARTSAEKTAAQERSCALEERAEELQREVAKLHKIIEDMKVEHSESLEEESQRFRKTASELTALRGERDILELELGHARTERERMKEQTIELNMRVRDEEREKNEMLEKERERLREVAQESTWAHDGLHALTDEHEILQQELQSLEESLIHKEQRAREQEQETKGLRAKNAELEEQLQTVLSTQSSEVEDGVALLKTLQDRDAVREALIKDLELRLSDTLKSLAEVEGQLREVICTLVNPVCGVLCARHLGWVGALIFLLSTDGAGPQRQGKRNDYNDSGWAPMLCCAVPRACPYRCACTPRMVRERKVKDCNG
jgi:chromosome segregation ATPase